jgi:hypothetical protein
MNETGAIMKAELNIIRLTEENFRKTVLESSEPILVEIGADWCGSCHIDRCQNIWCKRTSPSALFQRRKTFRSYYRNGFPKGPSDSYSGIPEIITKLLGNFLSLPPLYYFCLLFPITVVFLMRLF